MKKNILRDCLFFLITLGALLLASEFGFRLYTHLAMSYDIEMHKYARELKRRSSVPGLSHEHIPGARARLMGVDIALNSLGFRGEEVSQKTSNEYRVLVMGSSVTLGWGVPYESVFTTLLGQALSREHTNLAFRVLNAGIGNYNSVLENALFQRVLPTVEPDLVILHYFIRDAEVIEPKNVGWLVKNSYLAAFLYVRIQQTFVMRAHRYASMGDYYEGLYRDDAKGWAQAQQAVLSMAASCAQRQVRFVVALQPDLHDLSAAGGQARCHSIIKRFLESRQIEHLDLMDVYRERFGQDPRESWVSPEDSHPNAKGHKVIYEKLRKYLDEKILPSVLAADKSRHQP